MDSARLALVPLSTYARPVPFPGSRSGPINRQSTRRAGHRLDEVAGLGGVLERGQVVLGVQGRGAAAARGGDGLAVGVVDDVAGREDPREVGARRASLDLDVA